jgi:hypothetical protein
MISVAAASVADTNGATDVNAFSASGKVVVAF